MTNSSRREFLRAGAGAALSAALFGAAGCQSTGGSTVRERPNIILILADDMGYSDIGCYGGEIETPNIDRLAGEGLRFTQFYNVARCCPSRASLLTGLYNHQTGIGQMTWGVKGDHPAYKGYLNEHCVTIAEALRPAGYRTAITGKWHVGDKKGHWPLDRGFEQYTGGGGYFNPMLIRGTEPVKVDDDRFYMTDAISDASIGYIDDFRGSPFFLHVAYTAPHWPLHAFPEDIAKYRERYRKGWDALRDERRQRMIKMGLIDARWPLTPRDERIPAWEDAPDKEWQIERMAVYAAMVDRMDRGIGRIMQKLKDAGIERNTLVLFLSDNGGCAEEFPPHARKMLPDFIKFIIPEFTHDGRPVRDGNDPTVMPGPEDTFQTYGVHWANVSNTPFRLYKHWIHEGGIATPLIAYWPGVVKGGTMTNQTGHVIDVMATCVDLARTEYPKTHNGNEIVPLEGKSLTPILEGKTRPGHDALCWEHEGNRAVRQGKWKLVSKYPDAWELYDMQADRTEMNNLVEQNADKANELKAIYDRWAARCGVEPWEVISKNVPL